MSPLSNAAAAGPAVGIAAGTAAGTAVETLFSGTDEQYRRAL
ncbi:hypothetical protein [Catenulispora yoronensis]